NTTVDELVNLNDLVTNNIYVGQVLQIPNTGGSGVEMPDIDSKYTVQKGDTLYSIALKYNTTPSAIINKNNLTSDILSIGQIIDIPSDVESTGNIEDVIDTNSYIVQKGDSLYSISRRYNVSINDIKNANNLVSDILTVGQILTIPSENSFNNMNSNMSNLYMVEKGDTLWSIANKFGTSVNTIRMVNNLNSDVLSIGQTLIIP
ncbi:MAG: LysM peptidoglycan-binding domain-containing protein, partial [Bacilli bacterium]|nr:LysM peptidoglycan-binding domain-containing protein [Bacilli bacterium]